MIGELKQFHRNCMEIKTQVFSQVWAMEEIAGIYAKYGGNVIGLLEVMPREILRKHGYITGTIGNDRTYLSVGCYSIAYQAVIQYGQQRTQPF